MNKEEIFKNLSDKDKKEVLSLMSFMKKFKEQERKKELYATYEEYLDLIHISEHLSNENKLLQSQLDQANKKLDKIDTFIRGHQLFGMRFAKTLYRECLEYILSIIDMNNKEKFDSSEGK
jgi:flagellar biosynthesis/type III secretory pathway ATPase